MVKQNQTNYQQFADELFECVLAFCGVDASRVNTIVTISREIQSVFVEVENLQISKWREVAINRKMVCGNEFGNNFRLTLSHNYLTEIFSFICITYWYIYM